MCLLKGLIIWTNYYVQSGLGLCLVLQMVRGRDKEEEKVKPLSLVLRQNQMSAIRRKAGREQQRELECFCALDENHDLIVQGMCKSVSGTCLVVLGAHWGCSFSYILLWRCGKDYYL